MFQLSKTIHLFSRSISVQSSSAFSTSLGSRSDLADFPGIAQPFAAELQKKLQTPLDNSAIGIKPDGIVYASQVEYRRVLNSVFGVGGWALIPRSPVETTDAELRREFALFAHGRFVAQAFGDQPLLNNSLLGNAIESARSNALTRCCKDIGIGMELWDASWLSTWRQNNAVQAWCTNVKSGEKRLLWRLKEGSFIYPWKETNDAPSASAPAARPATSSSAPKASFQTPEVIGQPFDPEEIVPAGFKKFAGKTWSEILSTSDGKNYLTFMSQNMNPPLGPQARRALDYWESTHSDDYEGV